jgi:outer membrane scaffolding protein for murein synthesis (MipA/OmpV family)
MAGAHRGQAPSQAGAEAARESGDALPADARADPDHYAPGRQRDPHPHGSDDGSRRITRRVPVAAGLGSG